MNRRNILKRLGAAGAAALAVGTTSASADENGEPALRVMDSKTGETVTLSEDCICEDDCYYRCCPCEYCLC